MTKKEALKIAITYAWRISDINYYKNIDEDRDEVYQVVEILEAILEEEEKYPLKLITSKYFQY